MKPLGVFIILLVAFLGLPALTKAAPAPVLSAETSLEVRASTKHAETVLKCLVLDVKNVNKKYSAIVKPNFVDITNWSKEVKGIILDADTICGGKNGTCDILDPNELIDILGDLLTEINNAVIVLLKKSGGLFGLDILLKFTIKLLFGELFAALMQLITSLLTLSGGSGLLGLLTPLLSGDLGNLLNLFGLLDKILGKSR